MKLTSRAFDDRGQIPARYTRDGENVAPPLAWEDVPDGTAELAVVFECTTPTAQPPFTQWLLYGIDPTRRELPEGLGHKRDPDEPPEALHGTNSMGNVGYDGPLGSTGKRVSYVFRLLALDQPLGLEAAVHRDAFDESTRGHILAEAELGCTYDRPPV
ncbi:MAG: YbhB/YbcL family Raf kinase inhibitor-like protein [Planctomycetes bacterium]|nr:YbhB/YbcL family Raf kinase inhibitor-like protein [Planctomycetota bacterium]